MAAACCVVATPSGGVIEQIENGVTGLLAAEISGSALAVVLREALGDAAMAARIGEAGRAAVVANFSESAMVERHVGLYEAILSK